MYEDEIKINKYSDLWAHTALRIDTAVEKSTDTSGKFDKIKFTKKMVTRLQRMTHKDKIVYAIAYLKEKGYTEVVDIYEGKLLMDELTR